MRKNIMRTFFAALLIFSALTVSAWAETGIVIGNGVNFREGPGTNYRVIASLDRGVAVNVTNRSIPGWYAVSCGGYNGFIASSYLSISSDTGSASGGVSGIYPDSSGVAGIYPDGYSPNTGTAVYPGSSGSSGGVSLYPGTSGGVSLYPGASGSSGTSGSVPVATSSPSASGNTGSSSGVVKDGYINAMYVRFRSGPSSSTTVIGEYNKGKSLQIYGYVNDWAACMIDGQPGYVHSDYVSEGTYSAASGSYWGGSSGGVSLVTPAPTYAPSYGYSGGVSLVPTAAPVVVQTPAPIVVQTPAPAATQPPALNNGQGILGYVVGSYVRFRSGPGTNYSILGTYNTGKAITVLRNMGNGWLNCNIDNVNGYIHGDYVLVYNQASYGSSGQQTQTPQTTQAPVYTLPPTVSSGTQASQGSVSTGGSNVNANGVKAYISGNNVRFRSGPSMTSALIGEFFYGNEVTLYGLMDGWAMVVYQGTPGYVYAQYVKEGSYLPSTGAGSGSASGGAAGSTGSSTPVRQGSGQDVANYALQFVGYGYKWGGASPDTGFDCSGFVYYVYKQFGYTLNRVAQDQVKNGVAVDPSAIQPGDVLCFYSGSSYIGHSGIYIGDGKFVHASNSTTGVIISELSGYYSARGFAARRIIP